jgi:hypothetical protein
MGTVGDWIGVAFITVFWGTVMRWVSLPIDSEQRTRIRVSSIQISVAGGFLVGLMTIFGLCAFRWPLLLIQVPASISFLMVARSYRKKLRAVESRESSLQS